jgi:hypothetical protein
MIASGAQAQNCQVVGNQIVGDQTLCSPGLVGPNPGTSEFWQGNTNRSGAYGSDGTSYQQLGNTKYFNNGTTSQTFGDVTYSSDGRVCQRIGGQITCN